MKWVLRLSIFCLLILVGVSHSKSNDINDTKQKAEQGDADAQKNLGNSYYNGVGIAKDAVEAVKWYRKAAEQGNAKAQYNLGLCYYEGKGVTKDAVEAVKWWRKAAEKGIVEAQYNLGLCYYEGEGVTKDAFEAVKWFHKAAEQGDAEAQYILGECYYKGEGVTSDPEEAVKWFHKAAEQGNDNAQRYLKNLQHENDRKSVEILDRKSQLNLGKSYYYGNGVEKNLVEAVKWFRNAAEQGDAISQNYLGICYFNGFGITKNMTEAVKWFRKAAEQGIVDAQYNLGNSYYYGNGVERDIIEGVKWFRKAAEQGDSIAQYNLGNYYYNGHGVPKDITEAVKWFRKAAEQGNSQAQYILGWCYENGEGVPKDEIESLAWINLAASSGDANSKKAQQVLENRLGREITLLAQQMSKKLQQLIEKNKEKKGGERISATEASAPEYAGNGTGVVISSDGLILTAAHVVQTAKQIKVRTSQGLVNARVLQVDEPNDLALLKCEGTFTPLPVAGSKGTKLGQNVFTIGFPNVDIQGFNPKVTKGEINSLSGMQDDPRQFQISVPVQPGNSGGPLLNENGEIVGIVVAKLSALKMAKYSGDIPQNVNYAIKGAYALPLLEPYTDRLPAGKEIPTGLKFEDLVEKVKNSVVLVLVYE